MAWISNSPNVSRLNPNSRVKEAAWKWMLFYTSEEAQRLLGEWKRGIPSIRRIAEEPATSATCSTTYSSGGVCGIPPS